MITSSIYGGDEDNSLSVRAKFGRVEVLSRVGGESLIFSFEEWQVLKIKDLTPMAFRDPNGLSVGYFL